MQCLKSQTFSDSCAQNRHDLLAKIVEHSDGTSGAERGCNTDWSLEYPPRNLFLMTLNAGAICFLIPGSVGQFNVSNSYIYMCYS